MDIARRDGWALMSLLRTGHLLIESVASGIVRNAYWLWRLSKADIGPHVSISFPLRLEGKGVLRVGEGSKILENVYIGAGLGSMIEFGRLTTIRDSVTIKTSPNGRIVFEDRCEVGSHSSLWTSSEWRMGAGSIINTYCAIFAREADAHGRFIMGKNSHIGDFSTLDVCDDLIIGDHVALGGYNIVYTHDHTIESDGPAWMGKIKKGKVVIEDNAWIGAGAIILPGVTIGKGAVVAAGAVVNRDVMPGDVVGGVPAKPLRQLCRGA